MCDSLRLRLTAEGAPDAAPGSVVAKLPAADPTSRATALSLRSYEKEVRFYQQLAPDLPVRTPTVFHADIDPATASFVLLLEDMAPARAGDQLAGCAPAVVASAVDELVNLHAPRWADPTLAELEAWPGTHDARVDGAELWCSVDAEHLGDLVATLGSHGVETLTCQPPTLEELFLARYQPQPA